MLDVHFIYPGKITKCMRIFLIYRLQKKDLKSRFYALRPENIHKIYHDMDKTEQNL